MSDASIVPLDSANFDAEVGKHAVVLVDFWADWCGPCHMLAPTIDALAAEYAGNVVVAKLDIDASPDIAERFAVMGIPTVIVLHQGKEAARLVGVHPRARYAQALDAIVGATKRNA